MHWSSQKLLLLLTAITVAAGCKPEIGDECQISTDCSAAGDRLCDITAPGGYCTVFNCEPGACPEDESLCVQFGAQRSPIDECQNEQAPSPYARTFCMATCESDSDCRGNYRCEDLSAPNEWGALLIDRDRGSRACVVPVQAKAVVAPEAGATASAFGDVCRTELSDASPAAAEPEPEPEPEPSANGGAGQGGAGG